MYTQVSQEEASDVNAIINSKYKVVEPIARGVWGIVMVVRNIFTNELFAMKKLYGDDEVLNESLRCAWAMKPIMTHPNILNTRELFLHRNTDLTRQSDVALCYIMRYYKNQDLKSLLQKTRDRGEFLSEKQIYRYMLQLSYALECLHNHGFVHRDLKPSHVMISDDFESLYLGGFGMSQPVDQIQEQQMTSSMFKYLSPEVVDSIERKVTPESEVWTLGCIFFEMITLQIDERNLYMDWKMKGCDSFQEEIKNEILSCGFSEQLYSIVGGMLQEKPERITLDVLVQQIRGTLNYPKQIVDTMCAVCLRARHEAVSSVDSQ
ncbi:serine/threonine-protein kinase [Acrasis kona]|uniref:non-specific serine/threonine protein kinase n=1 Tax=Acrasis kona TaxID=1008807 RepID=A0AAW2ZDI5_9EUKA